LAAIHETQKTGFLHKMKTRRHENPFLENSTIIIINAQCLSTRDIQQP